MVAIDPKIHFANERTFLSWMKAGVLIASVAIAILAFSQANGMSPIYGILLLPIAVAFCVYAVRLYLVSLLCI